MPLHIAHFVTKRQPFQVSHYEIIPWHISFSIEITCRYITTLSFNFLDNWEVPFESISDLQWLGSGAQGAVFVGQLDNEPVAVKKVKDEDETNIHHLRKLNHPNIIQFKGVCTQSPCYCIIMEYCPFGPLFNFFRDGTDKVPPKRLIDWSKQIASGMKYLHDHKIIHRDLKSPK